MKSVKIVKELGLTWWNVYSWLCIFGGTYLMISVATANGSFGNSGAIMFWGLFCVAINLMVGMFMLHYNRTAFLVMTILSLNPLVWIINGVYLKNRWNHPLVKAGSTPERRATQQPVTAAPKKTDFTAPALSVQAPTNDDYQYAAEELDTGNIDKGLWARLFSETDGDENRTRARYIKERVAMRKAPY
jgi:hypothetical protein